MQRKLASLILLPLLFLSMISYLPEWVVDVDALSPSRQDAIFTGDIELSRGGSTYITGVWSLDYTQLNTLTNGQMNLIGFQSLIENYFLPLNLRFVMLWLPGWRIHANTTLQNIGYDKWVDEWLSACDKYGIANVFYIRQWGVSYKGRSWDNDVYAQFPDMQTFNKSGFPLTPDYTFGGTKGAGAWYAPDDPRFVYQLKEDLKQLWEYYGEHPSWIGLATHYGDYAHYASRDEDTRNVGFGNFTIKNFADTIYFLRDVDENGFHKDGTKCKIWEMFIENEPLLKMESGERVGSSANDVYGGVGSNGHVVAIKFKAPVNLDGFRIVWYGCKVGSPTGSLRIGLYRNEGPYDEIPPYGNDKPEGLGSTIEYKDVNASDVASTPQWQNSILFNSRLAKGDYYWLVFQTEGGDENNKYQVYKREYKVDESTVKATSNGYNGSWSYAGGAILKIQDANGEDLRIHPYVEIIKQTNAGAPIEQLFTPTKTITVNTVFVFTSDRLYDEGYTLIRIMKDDEILATANLTQNVMNGLYWWVPVQLNSRITLSAGVQYKLRIERAVYKFDAWQFIILRTDPASESFGGTVDCLLGASDRDLLFKLADLNVEFNNFLHLTEINTLGLEVGKPGITYDDWIAIRFKPLYDGPFTSFAFKVMAKYGSPTGLTVSLFDGNATQPIGSALESLSVDDSYIDAPCWVNITGWKYSMQAGKYYWVVMRMTSRSADSGYRTARVPNPYNHPWVWSNDGGVTWNKAYEVGDFILRVRSEMETWSSEPDIREAGSGALLSDTKWVAQSFYVKRDVQIKGFLVVVGKQKSDYGNPVFLEVRTNEDGQDRPSNTIIASGILNYDKNSIGALRYFDLDFPAKLTANTKYWLVFKSNYRASTYIPIYFFKVPQESYGGTEYHALRTVDGGSTWNLANNLDGDIIFAPVSSPSTIMVYNTSQLSKDIDNYHAHRWTDEPLTGWNSYLILQTNKILKETVEWFSGYTGRKMIGIDTAHMRIIEENEAWDYIYTMNRGIPGPLGTPPSSSYFRNDLLSKIGSGYMSLLKANGINEPPYSSWGNLQDNTGYITPEQIRDYYLATYPLLAPALHIFDSAVPRGVNNLTQHMYSRAFGNVLSRMRYYGGYFGIEKGAVNVLLIGDMDIGVVAQFLTPALNVTLVGFGGISGDYNLTRFGDFSQFDVIVFWAGRPAMSEVTPNAQQRIKTFVNNGGGIVSVGKWAQWADEIFGDGLGGEGSSIPSNHPIWKPYHNEDFIDNPPHICEHNYGSGRAVHISAKRSIGKIGTDPDVFGAPRDSWLVLFTNTIFYAAKKDDMIPVWWYPQYRDFQAWHSQLYYSLCGRPGKPILLWLSNNGTTTNFEIHLNASFYGIDPAGWIAIDVQSWSVVARGSGNDITITTTIPDKSWKPIYIMNITSSFSILEIQKQS